MGIIVLNENLYISRNIANADEIIANTSADNFKDKAFLICLNSASKNLMDIYYIQEFKKPYINTDKLIVLAICRDKADSKEACAFIIERFMQEYNNMEDFKTKVGLIGWGKND